MTYPPKKTLPKKTIKSQYSAMATVLQSVAKSLDLDKQAQMLSLRQLWKVVLSEQFGKDHWSQTHTRLNHLETVGSKTTLHVAVTQPALATEFSFYLANCQTALNLYQPQTGVQIDQIKLLVRPAT